MIKFLARKTLETFPALGLRVGQALLHATGRAYPVAKPRPNKKAPPAYNSIYQDLLDDMGTMPDEFSKVSLSIVLFKHKVFEETDLIPVLQQLYAERHLTLLEETLLRDELRGKSVAKLFEVRLSQYRGDGKWNASRIFDVYSNIPDSSRLKSAFFNLYFQQAAWDGDFRLVQQIINDFDDGELAKMSSGTIMGAGRLLLEHGQNASCRLMLERFLPTQPEVRKLDFLEIARAAFEGQFEPHLQTWRDVAERLDHSYPAADEQEKSSFQRMILKPLRRLPRDTDRDFLDIRFNNDQKNRLLEKIEQALESQDSFSFIRLNDGEGYAYDNPPEPVFSEDKFYLDNLARERHWWGTTINESIRQNIKQRVQRAAANADLLGIPTIYRIIRTLGNKSLRFAIPDSQRSQRGLLAVVHALGNQIPMHGQLLTEERANQILFDADSLKRLIGLAKSVVFVGCWSSDQLQLSSSVPVEYILVSAHSKVRSVAQGEQKPLYLSFPEVDRKVSEASKPGALVLVSAGLIGKMFCETARLQGAVALDIGSVSDYLAGYQTRPAADIVGKYKKTDPDQARVA